MTEQRKVYKQFKIAKFKNYNIRFGTLRRTKNILYEIHLREVIGDHLRPLKALYDHGRYQWAYVGNFWLGHNDYKANDFVQ